MASGKELKVEICVSTKPTKEDSKEPPKLVPTECCGGAFFKVIASHTFAATKPTLLKKEESKKAPREKR